MVLEFKGILHGSFIAMLNTHWEIIDIHSLFFDLNLLLFPILLVRKGNEHANHRYLLDV